MNQRERESFLEDCQHKLAREEEEWVGECAILSWLRSTRLLPESPASNSSDGDRDVVFSPARTR